MVNRSDQDIPQIPGLPPGLIPPGPPPGLPPPPSPDYEAEDEQSVRWLCAQFYSIALAIIYIIHTMFAIGYYPFVSTL